MMAIRQRRFSVGVIALILIAGVVAYIVWDQVAAATQRRSALALGAALYQSTCASCHGARLQGQPDWQQRQADGRLPAPPHDETGHTWHHSDEILFNLTKFGPQNYVSSEYQSNMPAFAGILSDEEIIAVLEYIKSTWSEETRRRQAGRK
ncbi:MAG: cytochrome C [Erythrobacter sp.]|nr:cytochrome C [Erythrobacter sp.]